jgi:acetyl esterase/lipase
MLTKPWILIFTATLAATLPAVSLGQTSSQQSERFIAMTRRPLQYDLKPDRVDVRRDVAVGKRADGSALTLDLYLPKKPAATQLPVVLLVHGGLPDDISVRPTQWQMYQDWGTVLAQSGVAAVMFNHRLGYPQRRIDEAMNEVDQIMEWLQKSAATHRLDTAKITAAAFSAGGLVVPELVRRQERIRGYVLYYPLLGADSSEVESADVKAKLRFVDVLPLLAKRDTPVLMFRSGADEVPGLLAMLDAAVPEALRQDVRLELVNLPKAPHAFDSLTDDAATRRAIKRTIEFALDN